MSPPRRSRLWTRAGEAGLTSVVPALVPVVSGRELDAAYGCCNGRHRRADLLELSPADDQDPVEAVPADGADPAFGERVRRRGPERVRMISTPSLRKASSKTLLNLLS